MDSKYSGYADPLNCYEDSSTIAAQLKRSIAIIEPDVTTASQLHEALKSLNAEVRLYGSAESYLQCSAADLAEFVVAEVALPGLSGLDLLRRLRARQPQLPVILLSGEGNVQTAVAAIRHGATDFIEKPDVHAALYKRLAHLMCIDRDPDHTPPDRSGDDLH